MKNLELYEIVGATAKGLGRPVLYLRYDDSQVPSDADPRLVQDHLHGAAPYLDSFQQDELQRGGFLFLACEDLTEARRLYGLTIGDDGPTATNSYKGPVRVYALLADRKGNILTDNT